jgi:hypothetical protein
MRENGFDTGTHIGCRCVLLAVMLRFVWKIDNELSVRAHFAISQGEVSRPAERMSK